MLTREQLQAADQAKYRATPAVDVPDAAVREAIAERIIDEVVPLLHDKEDGYDCCGCSTYGAIVEHCLRIVRDQVEP